MSASIEEAVRAAQQRQADRAVDPGRVMVRLSDRRASSPHRRRTVLFAAAAAVVVAAVPVALLIDRLAPPPVVGAAVPPTAGPDPLPLRYSPGWVPAGLVERDRKGAGERLERRWTSRSQPANAAGNDPNAPLLSVDLGPLSDLKVRPPNTQTVDVNGRPGFYFPPGDQAILKWQIDDRTVITLTLQKVAYPKTTLLQVAKSVRPDAGTLDLPFRLRAVPGGSSVGGSSVTGTGPADWVAITTVAAFDAKGVAAAKGQYAQMFLGTKTLAPNTGTATTVAGRPARYGTTADGRYVVVDLGHSRWLTVRAVNMTVDQMNALAAEVEISPTPDPAWLG